MWLTYALSLSLALSELPHSCRKSQRALISRVPLPDLPRVHSLSTKPASRNYCTVISPKLPGLRIGGLALPRPAYEDVSQKPTVPTGYRLPIRIL